MKLLALASTLSAVLFVSPIISKPVFADSQPTLAVSQAQSQLHQLLDEVWQYELSQFPGLARSKGVKTDVPFTDISPTALSTRNAKFKSFLSKLAQIDEQSLPSSDRISLLMQQYRLNNYVSQYEFKEYRVPITSEYGFHNSIANVPGSVSISDQASFDKYLNTLRAIPAQFAQQIAYMKEGMEVGQVQPKAVLDGFEDALVSYIDKDISKSPFFKPFENLSKDLDNAANNTQLVTAVTGVTNAYQSFYDFLVKEYIPLAKDDISVKTWPKGEAFYQNRMKHYTTTDLSAKQIHEIGLKEVARIRSEMQTIVDELKFDGDINDFIQFLRTDPQFYAQTPEDLIIVASYISKKMDAQLPKLFKKLPRTPYGVAPVPDAIAPKYTTGRYISPRRDDQPGYYWVNTYALDKRPLYALPALTLHEAVPGHHLQISLAAEMADLPEVRRSTYISAFGEGWGLYSEYLGLEVGIYDDPYDNFGRLSYEMWRACRLVVDTGMHMFGWSRQKALDYMLENTALSEHNVRTEIDRYISWPAQALSYKIGEIKIKELRALAEQALGKHFDLRDFHDALLANGSVPLFVLEENMQQFIADVKETHGI
jgi:uncharacterized protein (DUF885 family)